MKLYKLTDKNHMTKNGTKWGEGVEHTAPGGGELCTSAWLHAYRTPEQAVFMAPQYGYSEGVLWEADGDVGIDDGTMVGCTILRTLRVVPMPEITTEQRVEVAIRCTMNVYTEPRWTAWAEKWLSGDDRSRDAAWTAVNAYAAADAVADANADAAWATYAAADAVAYVADAKGATLLVEILYKVMGRTR